MGAGLTERYGSTLAKPVKHEYSLADNRFPDPGLPFLSRSGKTPPARS